MIHMILTVIYLMCENVFGSKVQQPLAQHGLEGARI